MSAQYRCRSDTRRAAVAKAIAAGKTINGFDYLEVSADQMTLTVRFLGDASGLTASNFRIDGGARITGIEVEHVVAQPGGLTLGLTVDRRGDYSTYTLRVVKGAGDPKPPNDFDPQLSAVEFSFKVLCESDFDCLPGCACHTPPPDEPEINYLARDYPTFRRLMFDRLSLLLPEWRERNPADVGVTLVELLAYAADHVAYRQDAVATEAYLGTARQRTSVRRHARLVDYPMHDGCNARVWVQVRVDADVAGTALAPALPKATTMLTKVAEQAVVIDPAELPKIIGGERFETMHDVVSLFSAHNTMPFYTWTSTQCCLPKGATRATLAGQFGDLAAGDVLIFKEMVGAETGESADADPTHVHAVRLTSVAIGTDLVPDDLGANPDITEIAWDVADALPFPLCVSVRIGTRDVAVSIALGNIVLADHGQSVAPFVDATIWEALAPVPESNPALAVVAESSGCAPAVRTPAKPRYRPSLSRAPLTQAASFVAGQPAAAAFVWTMRDVAPAIEVEDAEESRWRPLRDLLASSALERAFVVESDDDVAMLRFGDDRRGRGPDAGMTFRAWYRVGNGRRGNIGAGAIAHIVLQKASPAAIQIAKIVDQPAVTNPLPAVGGVEPEPLEDVRQKAPVAFRTNERAVVPTDYEEVAQRHPQVQRAAATFRWTGSWYTVYLTVDRAAGRRVDGAFKREILELLGRYRMAGVDVEVDAPRFVPLELELLVCVKPDYFRNDVQADVLEVLGSGTAPDGTQRLFHPDRFTFGQAVHLSTVYAAVHGVAGVQSVTVKKFQRRDFPSAAGLSTGTLAMSRLEIAQLENDPSFPEHGAIRLEMGGGR